MMDPFVSQDQLLKVLQHTCGAGVKIARQKILNQQHQYLVVSVQLQHPSLKVVVKLAGPESEMSSSFDRTAMLHELISEHSSIPLAEIVAVNMSFTDWPWRYLVQVYVPGMQWVHVRGHLDEQALSHAYHQIGEAVAQLHTIQFPGFGELFPDGNVMNSKPYLAAMADRARLSIKNPRLSESFLSVLDKHGSLFTDVHQASLCHEDLHGYNLLFHRRQGQWQLAAILDFDKAWAGYHEIDLARMEFWRGMTDEDFWMAYKEIQGVEPAYNERRPIYQLLWCFEYARHTAEHLADTQQLCRRYGFPSPAEFD